jgi:asparagine synthase (glutamine-hydrolysing)
MSVWDRPSTLVLGTTGERDTIIGLPLEAERLDDTKRMMLLDALTYLPDDILVKVDRASMGVSLETRAPFLDHRVAEFCWRLPISMKVRGGQRKWLLRQVLSRHLPPHLFDRPKTGFAVPIARWLRGPMRSWASDLLDQRKLRAQGHLNPDEVGLTWAKHLSGNANWQDRLWCVLMFESWLDEQRQYSAASV